MNFPLKSIESPQISFVTPQTTVLRTVSVYVLVSLIKRLFCFTSIYVFFVINGRNEKANNEKQQIINDAMNNVKKKMKDYRNQVNYVKNMRFITLLRFSIMVLRYWIRFIWSKYSHKTWLNRKIQLIFQHKQCGFHYNSLLHSLKRQYQFPLLRNL